MAAAGRRERSSHSAEQPDIIKLGSSIHSEGTAREGFSLSPTKQLGYGSSSLLELPDLAQVGASVNRPETDTNCLGNPGRGLYQLQFKDNNSDDSSISSAKSEKSSGSQGPTSASQVPDITREFGGNVISPTQSPPLQTMDRVGGRESYDPFRIPSAVFQRSRSITPLEWSIASNESLFSIHVGNNSFSRDHALVVSELGKSGELTTSGELTKSGELFEFNPPLAVIASRETEMKSVDYEEEPKMADTIEYNINDKDGSIEGDLSDRNVPTPAVSWNSSSKSRYSNRSQSSSDSFAFPILADEEAQGGPVSTDAKFQGNPVSSKSTAKCWCCSCFFCSKWSCWSCSCFKWSFCSYSSCFKWNCCSCSCFKGGCCSCSSCYKWICCSCPSCHKWSCISCSSCYKGSCCSCSSCFKWSCGSCSSCCKWNCGSCSSCCTWSCCSSCHFSQCCHYRPRCRPCCHFSPRCHIYPSCHFCRRCC